MKPELRATGKQRAEVYEDMHALISSLVCSCPACEGKDLWEAAQRQAKEMTRGFPSTSLSGERGSSSETVVERAAFKTDQAVMAEEALASWNDAYNVLRSAVKNLHRITHAAKDRRSIPPDDCQRCGRQISGTLKTDQNRAGLCSTSDPANPGCYEKWAAQDPRPERTAFLKTRDCTLCGLVIEGESRTFADQPDHPYHADSCYHRVYRQRRKGA